ncbi:hypothetical protein SLS55_001940 [Diplodia seriata]|uniref:Uncharacterized protein n=2 Tax=Diplodia seriata TaxID=420778 RepID=A0A1S8B8U8_9PEZI|nr:hypothetical protein BK809_0005032 [Diplodia seriata]
MAEEDRRKEVEEYGFNPNHDPTLPAVGGYGGSEMAEDSSGYRGWGNTTTASTNRKASTTISGGLTAFSDTGSQPGGYQHSPGSPTNPSNADSGDPLMHRRETMDSEGIGALGAAPVTNKRASDIHRGPSNASSSYSATGRSDSSDNGHMQMNNPQDYYADNGYYQAYNPGYDGQPVVQNVAARRNTRIENPAHYPPAGNSGIAQNF